MRSYTILTINHNPWNDRSEAASIPLFRKPCVKDIYQEDTTRGRGYVANYTNCRSSTPSEASAEDAQRFRQVSAHKAHERSLLQRYARLKWQLKIHSPNSNLAAVPKTIVDVLNQTRTEGFTKVVEERWLRVLYTTMPTPDTLSALDTYSLVRILQVLEPVITWKRLVSSKSRKMSCENQGKNLAAWTWGLLASLEEPGNSSSDEICIVRAFGSQAAEVIRDLKSKKSQGRHDNASCEPLMNGTLAITDTSTTSEDDGSDSVGLVEGAETDIVKDHVPDRSRRNSSSSIENSPSSPQQSTTSQPSKLQSSCSSKVDYELQGDQCLGEPKDTSLPPKANEDATLLQKNPLEPHNPSPKRDPLVAREDDSQENKIASAMALLNMIVTVVGIQFGQRDLLHVRERLWGAPVPSVDN